MNKKVDSVLPRSQILIVTDDADASRAWARVLSRYDLDAVVTSYDGLPSILSRISSFREVLVDHHEDPAGALQVCQRLRSMTQQPLLLFTYETDERYHIEAYRLGVEECVVKPIGIPLLVAKTRAWLRQGFQQEDAVQELAVHSLYLDPETRIFRTLENSVKLSNLECRLLSILMANRGQVMETGLLAKRVWSMYSEPDPRLLKNLVYRLRHKLGPVSDGHEYIESVAGIGYVFRAEN